MTTLRELAGTEWAGDAELWLDPMGDVATRSRCTVRVDEGGLTYEWSHEGKPFAGALRVSPAGAEFVDGFHSPAPMRCATTPGAFGSFVDVRGTYGAGEGPEWGWRVFASLRPDSAAGPAGPGELVVQMTNVTPWGEEVRAVRFVCKRAS